MSMATRAERKAKQRALWAAQDAERQEKIQRRRDYERKHPVLSGAVPVVDYQEPKWSYVLKPS